MTPEPSTDGKPGPSAPEQDARIFRAGAASGVAPALVAALLFWNTGGRMNSVAATLVVASVTAWPVLAVILASVRRTRRFGLGMLIGVGVGLLAWAAICGGQVFAPRGRPKSADAESGGVTMTLCPETARTSSPACDSPTTAPRRSARARPSFSA
jgi:hypothetical protein